MKFCSILTVFFLLNQSTHLKFKLSFKSQGNFFVYSIPTTGEQYDPLSFSKCNFKTDETLYSIFPKSDWKLFWVTDQNRKNSTREQTSLPSTPASCHFLLSSCFNGHLPPSDQLIFPLILCLLAINVHLLQSAVWFTPITGVYAPEKMIRLYEMNQ